MTKKVSLTIILPVYNEGKNIKRQIEELEKIVEPSHEILIVYDFDEDNTVPVVKPLQKKYKSVVLVKNSLGRGLINAVKTGIKQSNGQMTVIMPADLADEPQTINKMYQKIIDGFDVVCATRYTKGGKKVGGEFLKNNLSRIAGIMTPYLLGIPTTDIANGFKMYRDKVLKDIKIESTGGWDFSVELIVKAHMRGYKITETPTVWRDRTQGTSKFKLLKWLPFYLRWYLLGISFGLKINRLIV